MELRFRDRREAGQLLAHRLESYVGRDDVIILGLPRGGVPVAYEVARALDAPLDVFVVRKLGMPGHSELALGAIASGGIQVFNQSVVRRVGLPNEAIKRVALCEQEELRRRERAYRDDRPAPELRGKVVILIDDGLATGATMRAALQAVRECGPSRVIVAVPSAAAEVCAALCEEADEVVCAITPEPFNAVGLWYEDFTQTPDSEVRRLLQLAAERHAGVG